MAAANPSPRPESSTASSDARSGHSQNKLVSPDSNTKHVQASSDVQFKRSQNRLISPDSNTRHVQAQYKLHDSSRGSRASRLTNFVTDIPVQV